MTAGAGRAAVCGAMAAVMCGIAAGRETLRPIYLEDAFLEPEGVLVHWRYDPRVQGVERVEVVTQEGWPVGMAGYPIDRVLLGAEMAGGRVGLVVTVDGQRGPAMPLQLPEAVMKLPQQRGRIGIRRREGMPAELYSLAGGERFIVRGFNYIRLRNGDHSTFEAAVGGRPADYDPYDAESMLRMLRSSGFNTVRVFIIGRSEGNPGIGGDYEETRGLYEPYMRNVADFLRRARRHGIYVLPTFGDGELPRNRYYRSKLDGLPDGGNAIYLTKHGIEARREYVTEFLRTLQRMDGDLLDSLLGVQLQNELSLDGRAWPFSMEEGTITAANARRYDMADAEQRQRLMDEGIAYYHEQLVRAVKEVDPGLLVSEGIFTLRAVGKSVESHRGLPYGAQGDRRYPPTLAALADGPLDFLDLHFYRTRDQESVSEAFAKDMASVLFTGRRREEILAVKPVILGEFGSFAFVDPTFEQATENLLRIRDLSREWGMSGGMMWTFDCFEQGRLWHAMQDGGAFVQRLAQQKTRSVERPGPVVLFVPLIRR